MRKSKVADKPTQGNKHRYFSYREAWARISSANRQGFYLESVTIVESILSDRIRSYMQAQHIFLDESRFISLSKRVGEWRKIEKNNISFKDFDCLISAVTEWVNRRNIVVHAIVSQRIAERESIDDFLSFSKTTAQDGAKLARAVSAWTRTKKLIRGEN